jgi:hypothetical protein
VVIGSKWVIVIVEFFARLRIHHTRLGVVRHILDHLGRLPTVPLTDSGSDPEFVTDQFR